MTTGYIATETFGPSQGESWTDYIAWSGLTQLEELVSLDSMLCPSVLPEILDDHWSHIILVVERDYGKPLFLDLPTLLEAVGEIPDRRILRVAFEPAADPEPDPTGPAFEFLGYDLIDYAMTASPLSNCGGFPDVFANHELSPLGLLTSRARAFAIRDDLRRLHPEEPHADCHVWAISRLIE